MLVTGKACPPPFPLFGSCLLEGSSVTTVVHSVYCGRIKLCVRMVLDVWLLSVYKIEFCYFGKVQNLVLACMSGVYVFRVHMGCLLDGCMSS
jgi:hypothetical protein